MIDKSKSRHEHRITAFAFYEKIIKHQHQPPVQNDKKAILLKRRSMLSRTAMDGGGIPNSASILKNRYHNTVKDS